MKKSRWYEEKHGFFGPLYLEGDKSKKGHLGEQPLSQRQRTYSEVSGAIDLLVIKKNESIIDIPCGEGRHCRELTKRGFMKVVGADINSSHLRLAVEKARRQKLSLDFRKENMLDISYVEEFDVLINMFFSFGFFETNEENMRVLKNFYRALKPGGRFLMHTDVNIPRIIAGKYKTREMRALSSGNKLQIVERFNQDTKRLEGSWAIIRPGGSKTKKNYSVRVYEKEEFIQMCLDAGFRKCKAYSNWKGDPYSEDSEEIMFVATK